MNSKDHFFRATDKQLVFDLWMARSWILNSLQSTGQFDTILSINMLHTTYINESNTKTPIDLNTFCFLLEDTLKGQEKFQIYLSMGTVTGLRFIEERLKAAEVFLERCTSDELVISEEFPYEF